MGQDEEFARGGNGESAGRTVVLGEYIQSQPGPDSQFQVQVRRQHVGISSAGAEAVAVPFPGLEGGDPAPVVFLVLHLSGKPPARIHVPGPVACTRGKGALTGRKGVTVGGVGEGIVAEAGRHAPMPGKRIGHFRIEGAEIGIIHRIGRYGQFLCKGRHQAGRQSRQEQQGQPAKTFTGHNGQILVRSWPAAPDTGTPVSHATVPCPSHPPAGRRKSRNGTARGRTGSAGSAA